MIKKKHTHQKLKTKNIGKPKENFVFYLKEQDNIFTGLWIKQTNKHWGKIGHKPKVLSLNYALGWARNTSLTLNMRTQFCKILAKGESSRVTRYQVCQPWIMQQGWRWGQRSHSTTLQHNAFCQTEMVQLFLSNGSYWRYTGVLDMGFTVNSHVHLTLL